MRKQSQQRQVKLHEKHSPRAYGQCRVVPWLTLSGVWLEKAGFRIGDVMAVTVSKDEIIVKRVGKSGQQLIF